MSISFKRVNKQVARRLFNENKEFWITAVCMLPQHGIMVSKAVFTEWDDFDKMVNAFEYYNCDNERGRYAAFYVEQ